MAYRTFRPTSPSRRKMTVSDFADVTERGKNKPEKSLVRSKSSSGGRNNAGRTAVRFRGGGHKRRYREIDFRREKLDVPAKVARVEYDPNRTAHIALVKYLDGERRYILAPKGVVPGDEIRSGADSIRPLGVSSLSGSAGSSGPRSRPWGCSRRRSRVSPSGCLPNPSP